MSKSTPSDRRAAFVEIDQLRRAEASLQASWRLLQGQEHASAAALIEDRILSLHVRIGDLVRKWGEPTALSSESKPAPYCGSCGSSIGVETCRCCAQILCEVCRKGLQTYERQPKDDGYMEAAS